MAQQDKVGKTATVIGKDDDAMYVQYHQTKVVTWDDKKIILDTGGYETAATKSRMNQASNQFNLGYRVYQEKGNWFVTYRGDTYEFKGNKVILITETPIYSDDRCEQCHFLGNYHTNSLYYCSMHDQIIVQWGKGFADIHVPDNWRKLEEGDDPCYFEAQKRAVQMGLVQKEEIENALSN